jgi:hypothetical protein
VNSRGNVNASAATERVVREAAGFPIKENTCGSEVPAAIAVDESRVKSVDSMTISLFYCYAKPLPYGADSAAMFTTTSDAQSSPEGELDARGHRHR